jgi:tripartite-type tricarboxylate transporter receptor subunit TctC
MTHWVRLMGCAAVAALIAAGSIGRAQAQADYPNREVKVVVGFAAGGGGDILARFFSDKLSQKAGKQFIVENKVGAIGNIASEYVAKSKPDGYTLQVTGANGTHAAAKYLFKKLPFDPQKDFTPITTVARLAFIMLVRPETPAKSVAELTSYLKQKKGAVYYGTSNTTSLAAAEMYGTAVGVALTQVNYKTTGDAFNDLVGGQIDFMFMDATFSLEQARSGKLRALAVSSAERMAWAPELPGMREAGMTDFDLSPWWAFFGPAGLPDGIRDKLEGWLNAIVKEEDTKKILYAQGTEPFPGDHKMMEAYLAKEIDKWGRILKAAKVEPQ